ncbi:MAG: AAA family ATPase [Thermoplasmata archaeon]|nr:AAA family ATPase [Thermoplasmata archaeon]
MHILLYAFGDFPGQPDAAMNLFNKDFLPKGSVEQSHLGFLDRDMKDEVKYIEELYILAPSRIKDVLRGEQRGLPLHLTVDQANVLSTHRVLRGPILLSGEAGSGKTIVITHWLLTNQAEKVTSQLFVTFSERLVDRTRFEFDQMLTPEIRPHGVRFQTYRELLWEIANTGGLTLRDPTKEMTFERFLREYAGKVREEVDPVLLWDEIRSVIKGGSPDLGGKLIDYTRYEQMSRKRGRCKAPEGTRRRYHHQALLYQNYLDEESLWDAIDLAFDCLDCVNEIPHFKRVACDEVQDLAPVEISVLIGIVKDRNIDRIFFTGDIAQVINPSGFTWSKLKGDLGKMSKRHDIRDAWSLGRNFRSTSQIVDLVNEVIRIRESLLADASGKTIQKSDVSSGLKPMILEESPIEEVKRATSNPQQRLILVKTIEGKDEVRELLGKDEEKVTILTVEEAKGLEWDGVLLWDFFIPRYAEITKDDWDDLFIPKKRQRLPEQIQQGEKNPYGLEYEFNLLHVGLTRARKILAIYDKNKERGLIALGDSIEDKTTKADLSVFSAHWKTDLPSPEELCDLAEDLLEKDLKQAHRFFRLAAREYQKMNELDKAGECYEKAEDYELAATCYDKAGSKAMSEKMLALDQEVKMDWEKAGIHWEAYGNFSQQSGDWSGALDGYGCASTAYSRAAELTEVESERRNLYSKAATMLEQRSGIMSRLEEGRYQVLRAENLTSAAELWEKAESYKDARRAMEGSISIAQAIAKSDEKATVGSEIPDAWIARCYTKIADYESFLKNPIDAAKYALKGAKSYRDSSEKTEHASDKETYLDEMNTWDVKAVDWFFEGGQADTALDVQNRLVSLWRKKKDDHRLHVSWKGLVELLRKVGRSEEYIEQCSGLVEHMRMTGEKDAAYRLLREQISWCEGIDDFECLESLLEIKARSFVEDEEYSQAGRTFDDLGNLRFRQGLGRDAISSFVEAGSNHMLHRMRKAAMDSFRRGYDLARAEMSPSSIGWYCFKEVVLDSLVPANLEDEAKTWTNMAVDHLYQEYERSVSRLKEHAEKLEGRHSKLGKELRAEESVEAKEEIKDKLLRTRLSSGWTWLCLAILHQRGRDIGTAPPGHGEHMIRAFDRSEELFEEVDRGSMISYVRDIRRGGER